MRDAFCRSIMSLADTSPATIFLTGDLGFKALEPVAEALGPRFINMGVAEQNMVSVAAGLARSGLRPWVYSIAPFLYARAFEQIRNDACFHDLPLRLVGNGGGFGYGVMGPSHHALEDYGLLGTLPNMRIYVPAFDGDIDTLVKYLDTCRGPSYLRLGLGQLPKGEQPPAYAAWREIVEQSNGNGVIVVSVGAISGNIWAWVAGVQAVHPIGLWIVGELPLASSPPPPEFLVALKRASALVTIEEHVRPGGFGDALVAWCAENGVLPSNVRVLTAKSQLSERYGSQAYHRAKSGLDPESISNVVASLLA